MLNFFQVMSEDVLFKSTLVMMEAIVLLSHTVIKGRRCVVVSSLCCDEGRRYVVT